MIGRNFDFDEYKFRFCDTITKVKNFACYKKMVDLFQNLF